MEALKIDVDLLKTLPLPEWDEETDKASRGKLLLIAGSKRIPGAAILAARAALRAGCGSVRVAAPESVALHIGIAVPELMVIPLPETKQGTLAEGSVALIAEQIKVCAAAIIGPGLDDNPETEAVVREVIASSPLPLVVDAQALPAFDTKKAPKAARILTPHSGEFETLSGKPLGDDREDTATQWAKQAKSILVLKGHHTFIASPEGDLYRNESGTRGLGTAGSGDVLAGIIGGLLAQGIEAKTAAVWGVYLHAQAGEAVAKDAGDDGLMARDFIDRLPGIQKYLRRSSAPKEKGRFGLRPA